MQTPSSNPKKNSARRRSADPHARLSARLRHISFGAAVLLVVVAALTDVKARMAATWGTANQSL